MLAFPGHNLEKKKKIRLCKGCYFMENCILHPVIKIFYEPTPQSPSRRLGRTRVMKPG
jgi:hypothetical protein